MRGGYYHQNERDQAVADGCLALAIVAALVVVMVIVAFIVVTCSR